MQRNTTFVDSVDFNISFPVWIPFISFSYVIPAARTPNAMLNKSGESGHPCLVPDLRGKIFQLLPIEYVVNCMLVIYGLSYFVVPVLCAHFIVNFIINEC